MATMADVPLYVVSDYAASERRITPSWSISQLKAKLEPVTGIPPSCQQIFLKQTSTSTEKIPVEASNEDSVYLQQFPLAPYAELLVSENGHSSSPSQGQRQPTEPLCASTRSRHIDTYRTR
jgi:tubulin-folding cofactor B